MDEELYEQHATLERDQWWFVARRAIIEAVLVHHLPPATGRRVLDVGCGTGGMLPMLARFGEVSGIEEEPIALAHCRSAVPRFAVRLGKIPDDVPTGGSFDIVTAFDVIEHIEDDRAALESLGAAVHPGGTVVITVPAMQWLWSGHDVANGHHRRYSRRLLLDVMGRAGLDVTHVSYFNTLLLPIVASARLVQRVRGRATAPQSDFSMPPAAVNRVLRAAMASERDLVARWGLPIGVSLIATAHRRD